MPQVIREAPSKNVVKEVDCRNCGVGLSYVPSEVAKGFHTDISGCKDKYNTIICPRCWFKIEVS